MTARTILATSLVLASLYADVALAQTSSIGARKRAADVGKPLPKRPREAPRRPRNPVYERYGWITTKPTPPKTFRPGDLITIIVREQRRFEADAELETKKRFRVNSDLSAFLRPIDRGIGAATFRRGAPNIEYSLDQRLKNEGDVSREDRLTTRLTAEIIDVKPNGVLVLEGRAEVMHDDETSKVTITGTCRKEDVTADNTVLSTQIANKVVIVENHGALRAASSRGWLIRLLDILRPI